jgi:hypothetical protein
MAPVSSISAMKVDTPRAWQSPAPTRAKIASRGAMRAESAGTKQPTWRREWGGGSQRLLSLGSRQMKGRLLRQSLSPKP